MDDDLWTAIEESPPSSSNIYAYDHLKGHDLGDSILTSLAGIDLPGHLRLAIAALSSESQRDLRLFSDGREPFLERCDVREIRKNVHCNLSAGV